MKKATTAALLIFILLTGLNIPDNEAKQLFDISRQKLELQNIRLSLRLNTTNNKGQSKSRNLNVVYARFDQVQKVMFEFTEPDNISGTKILATDYPDQKGQIEIFMPATGRIQKIKANQRNMKIMGSEIPIEQFRHFNHSNRLYSLLGKEELDGISCHKIKITPTDEDDYEVVFISVEDELILQVNRYDSRGKILSSTRLTNYRPVHNSKNKIYPQFITVTNYKSGEQSQLEVLEISTLPNPSPSIFNLNPQPSR